MRLDRSGPQSAFNSAEDKQTKTTPRFLSNHPDLDPAEDQR
jgi:hypothetical protein